MDIALEMGRYSGDIVVGDTDLARDDGLETSVIISLFTDRRAESDQLPPEFPADDLRGWWGDVYPLVEGDQTGSLLWLLYREKQTDTTRTRAQQYAEESLAWLTEDQIAERVIVRASYVATGWLLLEIDIVRPTGEIVRYRYGYEWTAQAARRMT
jgi:phage gp46-like protein